MHWSRVFALYFSCFLVGAAIPVVQNLHPTQFEVDRYHSVYVRRLKQLFNQYKGEHSEYPEATLEIAWICVPVQLRCGKTAKLLIRRILLFWRLILRDTIEAGRFVVLWIGGPLIIQSNLI